MKTEQKEIFTHGIWKVKPGKQTEFVKEWASFASWSNDQFEDLGKAYLLADRSDSLRFVSFGPWYDEEIISQWRETERFTEFVGKVSELCDDFKPYTLDVAATSR